MLLILFNVFVDMYETQVTMSWLKQILTIDKTTIYVCHYSTNLLY